MGALAWATWHNPRRLEEGAERQAGAREGERGTAREQQIQQHRHAMVEAMQAQAAKRERQPVSGAAVTDPSPPLFAHAAALVPPRTLPLRVVGLEDKWSTDVAAAVASSGYLARVDAAAAADT